MKVSILKVKREFGKWAYYKETPTSENNLDAPIYYLFNSKAEFISTFGSYGDMKYFVMYGVYL